MDEASVIETLLRLDLLKPVPDDSKDAIAKLLLDVSDQFDVATGENVLEEGHLGFKSGYIMLSGAADVVKGGEVKATVKVPALLGEMSQFQRKDTRGASIRTTAPATFLQFDWDELYERAEADLGPRKTHLLRVAVERLVFKRFNHGELLQLGLFNGLGDDLAYKCCVVFPWLTERVTFPAGEVLFHATTRCQSKGYLIIGGSVQLRWEDGREATKNAPDIIGVMPAHDPKLSWSATATASTDVTALVFNWQQYTALIQERLAPEERAKVVEAFRANAAAHFWH